MSYLNEYIWEFIPRELPKIKRNCPKCNEKTNFINSKKFRVNANKNNIDVWIIYQCEKCKSTWNMTILERVNPALIKEVEYNKFMSNDKELVEKYSFDLSNYNKNKVEVDIRKLKFDIKKTKLNELFIEDKYKENETIINVQCKYPCELRVDKLIGENFNISRSEVKKMCKNKQIFSDNIEDVSKIKVKDKEKICILGKTL